MKKFADACGKFADIENPAKLEGRVMLMFLVPKIKPKKINLKLKNKNFKER